MNVIDEEGYFLYYIIFLYIKEIKGICILFVVVMVLFIFFYWVLDWIVIDLLVVIKDEINVY